MIVILLSLVIIIYDYGWKERCNHGYKLIRQEWNEILGKAFQVWVYIVDREKGKRIIWSFFMVVISTYLCARLRLSQEVLSAGCGYLSGKVGHNIWT